MPNNVLTFPTVETPEKCSECGRGLDPDSDLCSQCPQCERWMCPECSVCDCDRLALEMAERAERLRPGLLTRVRRWLT